MQKIRWGILSTGSIAHKFAAGLKDADGAVMQAVGSRNRDTADTFGDEFGIPHRHGSYEALAADPEVDVIYIGTPHPFHMENTLLCLDHGKAVLCEKPFALSVRQAREMIDRARAKNLFLMEAMWTRFLPVIVRAGTMIMDGAIGEPRMVTADFGFRAGWDEESRLLDMEMGGGGLLDVGVYTIALAYMVLGAPERIVSMAHLGATGVDEQAAVILGYPEGQIAALQCAIRTNTPHEAIIMGTEGMIRIHPRFWCATKMTVTRGDKEETIELPYKGNGYTHQAEEVMACMRAGTTESRAMPLDETLSIMRTMDAVRAQWGLRYPNE